MMQHARLVESLVQLLNSQKIEYAILGGIAVLVHGKPRFTDDVDVNILLAKKDVSSFLKKAEHFGFHPRMSDPVAFVKKNGVLPMAYSQEGVSAKCDFILAENALELAGIRRSKIESFGSVEAKVVTPEDLVIQKLTGSRPRDVDDVIRVLRRQKGRLDLGYIRGWLERIDALEGQSGGSDSIKRRLDTLLKEA